MTRKRILVVAAVIVDDGGRILLARRPADKHQGGLWEFPGGKVEAGEREPDALRRELEEELGLTPLESRPLIRIAHDYPDKSVTLSVWRVTRFLGHEAVAGAVGREGQTITWARPDALASFTFPAANVPIVAAARLPALWRITPALPDAAAVLAWARARQTAPLSLREGGEGWLLRLPGWTQADYLAVAARVLPLAAAAGVPLLLHGDPALLDALPQAAGVHMPAALAASRLAARRAAGVADGQRQHAMTHLLSVAAHGPEELASATALAADCALLSPLRETASHPGQPGLGWARWSAWVADAVLPVYALGGVGPDDLATVWAAGGQGVAGISAC